MTQAVHSAEGEDRSSYQKVGPWTSDAFGLVKATEATNWADPTFAENWANLRGERKPRGAYHFFHPEMNAAEQAEFFMSVLHKNGLEPGDMLVIDSEIIAGPGGVLGFADANWTERANVALAELDAWISSFKPAPSPPPAPPAPHPPHPAPPAPTPPPPTPPWPTP
jgi:Glycosyl hydrolases family 25